MHPAGRWSGAAPDGVAGLHGKALNGRLYAFIEKVGGPAQDRKQNHQNHEHDFATAWGVLLLGPRIVHFFAFADGASWPALPVCLPNRAG